MTKPHTSNRPLSKYARLIKQANKALTAGDTKRCERLANQALGLAAPNGDACFVMAACLLQCGENSRAVKFLKATLDILAPQAAALAYLLTLAYHRKGKSEAAKPYLALVAWDPELWDNLGHATDFKLVRFPKPRPKAHDPAFN